MSGANAPGPREPIELFLDNVEGEISALESVLQSKEVAVPQRAQKLLIKSLLRISGWVRYAFRTERNERVGASPDHLVALGRRYRLLIGDVQEWFLPYLTETDETYCPPEIGMAVDRLVGQIEVDSVVLLHPDQDPVPKIWPVWDLEANFLHGLGTYRPPGAASAKGQPQLFIFLSYPQVMARSPLIHTIVLSHEIEHLEDWSRGLSTGLSNEMELTAQDFEVLLDELKNRPILEERGGLPPVTFGERFTAEELGASVVQRWSELRDNWLSEITSDLLAVRNFGPAYFFALGLWSLPIGVMHVHSDTHPCSRLRLELMGRELRSMGLTHYSAGALGTARVHFDQWTTLLRDQRPTEGERIHQVAERYVRRAFPRIRQEVQRASTAAGPLAADSKNDIEYAVQLLRRGVPPAEILRGPNRLLKPCGLAVIFNAYFIFQSAYLQDLYELLGARTDEERQEALLKLDKLVLKAVEGSEIKTLWHEAEGVSPREDAQNDD